MAGEPLPAVNVSVEIRLGDAVAFLGVLSDHRSISVPGGVQVAIGDAYAGQELRVVFKLHVPSLAALGPAKVADVVIRYVTVGDEVAAHELTCPLLVNLVSSYDAATALPDKEVVEQVVVLLAARAVKEARRRADGGDLGGASTLLRDVAQALRATAPGSRRAEELLTSADEAAAAEAALVTGSFSSLSRRTFAVPESEHAREARRGVRETGP